MASEETTTEEGYKVIVIGAPKVGKTSLIQRFLFNEFSLEVPQTVKEERKVVMVKKKEVPLLVCDMAGAGKSHLLFCSYTKVLRKIVLGEKLSKIVIFEREAPIN